MFVSKSICLYFFQSQSQSHKRYSLYRNFLCDIFLDGIFDFFFIGSRESFNRFAILEENECWHARNYVFNHGQFVKFVNINFQDNDFIWIFCGGCVQKWGNSFAWSTPRGKEVNENDFISGIFQLIIKIFLTFNMVHQRCSFFWSLCNYRLCLFHAFMFLERFNAESAKNNKQNRDKSNRKLVRNQKFKVIIESKKEHTVRPKCWPVLDHLFLLEVFANQQWPWKNFVEFIIHFKCFIFI